MFLRVASSPRAWSLLLAADMAFFAVVKALAGRLPELLWVCNTASLLLVPAFWYRWTTLVGALFLVHLAIGETGHLYALFVTGEVVWVSAGVHLLPTLLAFLYMRRTGLPRSAPLLGLAYVLLMVALARAFTPPALNINLAFQRHGLLARWFPGVWSYRFAAVATLVGLLWAADALLAWWLRRPQIEAQIEG